LSLPILLGRVQSDGNTASLPQPIRFRSIRILPALLPALLLGLSSAAAHPAPAQANQDAGGSSSVPVIRSNTRAVVVDVVVTNGKDQPVTGLHKEDFELKEDGKPQHIDYFEEHTVHLDPKAPVAPLPALPPNVYSNVPAAPPTDSVNVLLLDMLNTPRPDQSYVREQIFNFLRTMKPNARVAIFTLGTRLTLLQGFTDNPALLKAALQDPRYGFKPSTTEVSRTASDDQDDKDELAAKAEAFGGGRGMSTAGVVALAFSQAEFKQVEADERTAITLDALQKLGRYLAAIPGRKNLVWFASQYPVYFFPHTGESQPLNLHREFYSDIKKTADLLTLSKVAVYPVSAAGLANDLPNSAENSLDQAGKGSGLLRNTMNGAEDRAETMSDMEQIAADTGGMAIFNTNDLNAALNRVIDNGAHYYTLIYTPANKEMNGDFRKIQIKLSDSKARLSYRRGYYAQDVDKVLADADKKAGHDAPAASAAGSAPAKAGSDPLGPLLTRGFPGATQILFAARAVPASPQPAPTAKRAGLNDKLKAPTTRYALDLIIDPKQVQLKATPQGTHMGEIRVELVAHDRAGQPLNWTSQTMGLNFDAKTYPEILKSGIPAHIEIDLPQSDVFLSAGILDLEDGHAGTLEIPLTATPVQAAANAAH
jgi:VWFA-related protein